jgi:hypothetical protein
MTCSSGDRRMIYRVLRGRVDHARRFYRGVQRQTTKHGALASQLTVSSRTESSGRNSVLGRLGNGMNPNLR